jgi:hypothetical protein
MEFPVDDRRVGDDFAVQVEHEMDAADGMVPIVVGEPFLLVQPECGQHQIANCPDFGRRELRR